MGKIQLLVRYVSPRDFHFTNRALDRDKEKSYSERGSNRSSGAILMDTVWLSLEISRSLINKNPFKTRVSVRYLSNCYRISILILLNFFKSLFLSFIDHFVQFNLREPRDFYYFFFFFLSTIKISTSLKRSLCCNWNANGESSDRHKASKAMSRVVFHDSEEANRRRLKRGKERGEGAQ